ncbi:MAG: hypothetical protein ABGZ53_22815 [Fuerstiella sp.]
MKPQYAALICALLLCAAGCAEVGSGTAAAASEITNTHCPVMGGEIDGETFVEWNGKQVGFCCPPCIDDWKDMADVERTEKLAEAAANAETSEDSHVHEDGEHDDAELDESDSEQAATSEGNDAE